jgi:hypothetical protein
MSFLKADLRMDHYVWQNVGLDYQGQPTRRSFDRMNGYQVLFLINCCADFFEKLTIADGHKIENRIVYDLPVDKKSELSVFQWLRSTFFND